MAYYYYLIHLYLTPLGQDTELFSCTFELAPTHHNGYHFSKVFSYICFVLIALLMDCSFCFIILQATLRMAAAMERWG